MTTNNPQRHRAIGARLMPWFEAAVCLVTLIGVITIAMAIGIWLLAVIGALWLASVPLRMTRWWKALKKEMPK